MYSTSSFRSYIGVRLQLVKWEKLFSPPCLRNYQIQKWEVESWKDKSGFQSDKKWRHPKSQKYLLQVHKLCSKEGKATTLKPDKLGSPALWLEKVTYISFQMGVIMTHLIGLVVLIKQVNMWNYSNNVWNMETVI